MKKVIFGIIAVTLLMITSCTKNNNPGGSWTFQSATYNTASCTTSSASATLTVSNTSTPAINSVSMVFSFFNGLPTTNGTYTVLNANSHILLPSGNWVVINASMGEAMTQQYYSTGGGNGPQKLSVTMNNGKISISGSGIELANTANPSDSSALTVNITQLQ